MSGYCSAACVTCTLLLVLSLLRPDHAEKRCDISSHNPTDTETLDLKRCSLSALPPTIVEFTRLKKLDLGFNGLTELPALPPSLEILFLLANRFEAVPPQVVRDARYLGPHLSYDGSTTREVQRRIREANIAWYSFGSWWTSSSSLRFWSIRELWSTHCCQE